jgi:hypothetical protein
MIKGEVQYLADTLLLQKLATIECGLTKNANLLSEVVDGITGIGSSIISDVEEKVKEKGALEVIGEYFAEGVVIKLLGPWGWLISAAANAFGFSIGDFIGTVFSYVKNKIENGQPVNLDEVNQIGEKVSKASHKDMFYSLRKAEFEGTIVKNGGMLDSFLKGKSGKMILVGIITWILKRILIGAGVAEVSKAVGDKVKNYAESPSENNTQNQNPEESTHPVKVNLPPVIPNSFKSSGDGNQYHINDGSTVWVVPLLNKSIEKTLIWWASTIYPELKGQESQLTQSNSFNNMASILQAGIEQDHPDYLTIPQGLHSRKDVVDRFAGSIKLNDSKDLA